jgi:hypothetical protein
MNDKGIHIMFPGPALNELVGIKQEVKAKSEINNVIVLAGVVIGLVIFYHLRKRIEED